MWFHSLMIFASTMMVLTNTMKHWTKFFSRLREAGLTVKPAKVELGFEKICFLGRLVGKGIITPEKTKIEKILHLSVPRTKKQVRALVGLISYYSKFIPDFSTIKAALTDLLKKDKPNRVTWTEDCQSALEALQGHLNSEPFLILPDVHSRFILRTDASSRGVSSVLLQYRD